MRLKLEDNNRLLRLRIESEEDLWLLSTTIREGDIVYSKTSRELKTGSGSKRKSMVLGVRVKKLEYQPFTKRLRLGGVIVSSPKEVDLVGLHHTLSVEPGMEIAVYRENRWDYNLIDKLNRASKSMLVRAVIASIDDEEFSMALLRSYGVEILVDETLSLPGKNQPEDREKLYNQRIGEYAKRIINTARSSNVKHIIIVGPAHWKLELARRVEDLVSGEPQRYNLILDNTSSGGVKGVYESIKRGAIQKLLSEAIIVEEDKLMREVNELMSRDPDWVVWGIDAIEKMVEYGAVDKLIVSSDMLRHPDPETRERIHRVLKLAEKRRSQIRILESLHPEVRVWIKNLGGIIATLRYRFNSA